MTKRVLLFLKGVPIAIAIFMIVLTSIKNKNLGSALKVINDEKR